MRHAQLPYSDRIVSIELLTNIGDTIIYANNDSVNNVIKQMNCKRSMLLKISINFC